MARTQRGIVGGGRGSGEASKRALLVINSGSATLKFSLFDDDEPQRPPVRGLFEMGSYPRLIAHADGIVVARREWPPEPS